MDLPECWGLARDKGEPRVVTPPVLGLGDFWPMLSWFAALSRVMCTGDLEWPPVGPGDTDESGLVRLVGPDPPMWHLCRDHSVKCTGF